MVRCLGSVVVIYNPLSVPLRTPLFDAQGRFSKPWADYFSAMGRKAGRSISWRGPYDSTLQYAVGDAVNLPAKGSLWIACQAQPFNGATATPGTDDTIWEHIATIPPGGATDQVLAKASDADYDVKWSLGGSAGSSELQVNGVTITYDVLVTNGQSITIN